MTLCWNGPLSRCWGATELKTQVWDRKSYTSEKLCYFNFRKKWIWAERRRSCVALCSIQQEGSGWEMKADGPLQVWLWEILRSSRAIWDQVMRADMELGKRPFSLTLMDPVPLLPSENRHLWRPLEMLARQSRHRTYEGPLPWQQGGFAAGIDQQRRARALRKKGRSLPARTRTDQADSPYECLE